jgi:competence protein ComEC
VTLINFLSYYRQLGTFWRRYPALFTGLVLLLMTSLWFSENPICYIPLAVVIYPLCGMRIGTGLLLCTFILQYYHTKLPLNNEVTAVEGTFYAKSVKEKRTPFGPKLEYQGTFAPSNQPSLPVKIAVPQKPLVQRPNSDYKYHVKGVIKSGYSGRTFIPLKNSQWIPVEPIPFSMGEWRYHAKRQLKSIIHNRFTSDKAARFLEGISTGDFQDSVMSVEFGRFGLLHIMAVSGFHFAVITTILCWVFFGIFGRRYGAIILSISLMAYFLFLGGTPSITRAWVSASLVMIGVLLGCRVKSLNSLGIGLFVVLALDPWAYNNLGFQFSFAITASILLFTSPFENFLNRFFPVRRLNNAVFMSRFDKWGYILLQWLKKGIALSLAVNICALPMTLYFFEKFPLWSLFFNLFFPLMVAVALFFLIFGLSIGVLLEGFGVDVNRFNNWYTEFMLNLTYNFPLKWDVYLRIDSLSAELIILFLTVLFTRGILLEKKQDLLDYS